MGIHIKALDRQDLQVLDNVLDDVFDDDIKASSAAEFLSDARHHLIVALDGEWVVGFVSAVHYVHPDKPAELWINEVGVAPPYQRRGIAKRLLEEVLAVGRTVGCGEAWVLTDENNAPAKALYTSAGAHRDAQATVMFTFPLEP